jgi:hypothetical protein
LTAVLRKKRRSSFRCHFIVIPAKAETQNSFGVRELAPAFGKRRQAAALHTRHSGESRNPVRSIPPNGGQLNSGALRRESRLLDSRLRRNDDEKEIHGRLWPGSEHKRKNILKKEQQHDGRH